MLVGFAVSQAFGASAFLNWALTSRHPQFGWPLAAVLLPFIPMVLVWLGRRRLVVLAGALPAAAAICYVGPWRGLDVSFHVANVAWLAVLVALAGYAERPGWGRFWPLGLFAIAPLLLGVVGRFNGAEYLALVQAFCILSIAWMVIDARPAIAMGVLLLEIQLPLTIGSLAMGTAFQPRVLLALVVTAITAVAVWRLRRQSARGEPA